MTAIWCVAVGVLAVGYVVEQTAAAVSRKLESPPASMMRASVNANGSSYVFEAGATGVAQGSSPQSHGNRFFGSASCSHGIPVATVVGSNETETPSAPSM